MTEKPFLQFDSDNFEIQYREYQDSDSENAIALEQEASQVPTLGGLIGGGTIFNAAYDTKCKKFSDHIIILAEAVDRDQPSMKRICGCACIGIKDIYFNKRKLKTGVLFDLRVSDKFQKRGIGSKLTSMLEESARVRGCQFLYLSVNGNNKKALGLYEKIGYSVISQRTINRHVITKGPIEDRNDQKKIKVDGQDKELLFKKLEGDLAKEHYHKFYANEDLALQNFDELTTTSHYLGTYAVTAGEGNTVGLSLFKSDLANTMSLKKLIFPVHYYTKDWFHALGLAILLLISYALTLVFNSSISSKDIPSAVKTLLGGFVFLVLSWIFIWINLKFNSFVWHMGNLKSRGRYTGIFYSLKDETLLKPMLSFLMERMDKISGDHHVESITYNADRDDIFLAMWKGKPAMRFFTLFMGKSLERDDQLKNELKNYKASKFVFFDPRDL